MNNCSDCNYKANNEDEKARPNCAVIGIYNHPQASIAAYYALHALQHRGQEASGITTIYYDEAKKKNKYAFHRGEGLVLDVFGKSDVLNERLKGTSAVGHNRYSTTGGASSSNIQPFNMIYHSGILALAHNGNLTNTKQLKQKLQSEGAIFQTTTDSELFMHLFAKSKETEIKDQILETLRSVRGAYSLCIITEKGLFAARDPHGVRPLSLGKLNIDGKISYIVASETAAFDILSAEYIRSIEHNELIHIDEDTIKTGVVKSYQIESEKPVSKHCIFEYVYFSRPDSLIFGTPVDKVRRKLGKNLALESPVKLENPNDKINVIAVPDSGNTATLGFAKVNNENIGNSNYEIGLIRSHYVGRTFISPGQNNREIKVKTKFNTVKGIIEGKNIVVVDDSIVRGTTSKSLIKLIREAKPKKLHMRITSPPVKYPCHYGMDFPSKEELIANHYESHEDIGNAIGVDSLSYLSLEQLIASVPQEEGIGYCTACFDGNYPIALDDESIEIRDNE